MNDKYFRKKLVKKLIINIYEISFGKSIKNYILAFSKSLNGISENDIKSSISFSSKK